MHWGRPFIMLTFTYSSIANLKKLIVVRREGKMCHFMLKRVKKYMKSYSTK